MIPRRVRVAVLIAFLCHGLFILTARYRLSYDAYTHMLFADHYARDWFSLWETRWYAGFTVVSYPPLTHQLMALFVPFIGFDAAFALILWCVVTAYPLAVYAFSRIFIGKTASSYAALASAILLPIYVTAYIFGQLPFLTATLFALLGSAALARYLREPSIRSLALAVSLVATSMAAHHATLLVQPFLIIAITVSQMNRQNLRALILRLTLFTIIAIPAAILVIWPFWQWGLAQTMQTPIDHLSRHNFLTDPSAQLVFFWPMYGPLVAVIPFVFHKWPFRFWGLIFSFSLLFLLGLGGTTPLPRLLFGTGWEWLTYDRFAFWASLTLLPFFGALLIRLRHRWKNRLTTKSLASTLQINFVSTLAFFVFAVTALGSWLTPYLFPTQPAPIDMQPIVNFLNQGDYSQWRYLTFGFGNQFTYLNLLTKATTIDGSYHTARTLPELRNSGIGEIDTTLWTIKGVTALDPILKKSGEYGVRWGFVNRPEYTPELEKNGWLYRETLSDHIEVWENPSAILPAPSNSPPINPLASFSWGTFPLLSLILTFTLGSLQLWHLKAEKIIRGFYAFLIGLIPIGVCFWYYRILWESPHDRVYLTYDSALFFLCDGLALLAVLLWLAVRVANKGPFSWKELMKKGNFLSSTFFLLSLCILASASILWSADTRMSLYVSLHLWLIFGLYLSLRDWPNVWKPLMLGLTAALTIEILAGSIGFLTQSTAFLAPLMMKWPGNLYPAFQGASILQLPNGTSVLRAYGTLPHPNILGGFALVFMLGPTALFLRDKNPNLASPLLFGAGIVLLGITFSRSAWLGFAASALILAWKSRYLERRRLMALLFIGIAVMVLTLLSTRALVLGRVLPSSTSHLEDLSISTRLWLAQEALTMIYSHPLTGVGIGTYTIQLAQLASYGYIIEPVHNIILLAGSELGIPGLIIVIGISVSIAYQIIKAKRLEEILISALLVGLGVIALLDHYLWTLAPGRLILGLMLGIGSGQFKKHES
ncbi:MAG: O-antigen ligase family protein [Anaerolineales bacterium]